MLTGDPENADPVCDKSPYHSEVVAVADAAASVVTEAPIVFRNPRNSRRFGGRRI
jgi:pyrroloquinoline quinone biosynthesis protein E